VKLKAYTLAGFIPWYDEFEEDVFIDLGSIFLDEFTEAYGQWKDFRDAVYKVPSEERKDCAWFLNETGLNHIANIEDANGRPIWRRPMEAMPGKLDLYPYHEVSIMPQLADIEADTPFAIFMNSKRIQHGDRKG
jgi:HK97 family phage major capsid protein